MSNPNQLYLLADHIKLSLLERKRAQSLNIDDRESDTQNGHISRSLEQFRDGLANLNEEKARLEGEGDQTAASNIADSLTTLQKQFDDLTAQFHGFTSPSTTATLTHPNDASLTSDFTHATTAPNHPPSSSSRKPLKSVRFSDSPASPSEEHEDPNHNALFADRYRDDPEEDEEAQQDVTAQMDNQQLHEYHNQVLQDQDEALDRIGVAISRQRELGMQMGDELDAHVIMLDEVDGMVDRHMTRLDRAKRTLNSVSKTAGENKQMTTIVVLIIVLVLLIAILK